MVDQCKYMIAFEFPKVKGLPSFSRDEAEDWPSCPRFHSYSLLNCPKTLGIHQKVRFLSSPLKNPGFPRVFRILGQLLWLSCLSMHVHACRCCVVLCAALPPGESSSESPESSSNPRFFGENGWFCSGGAGFELLEFESY
jgi:hypothetical protein